MGLPDVLENTNEMVHQHTDQLRSLGNFFREFRHEVVRVVRAMSTVAARVAAQRQALGSASAWLACKWPACTDARVAPAGGAQYM